ncbi:hypothetical protein GCM10029963_42210 [Micromonospora andamanensis]
MVATSARRSLDEAVPGLGDRVAAYRAGYLREERRELERALLHGDLLGLASTNALELGVDLIGLDAVVICGYPGTRASLWQQAGRAGRSGQEALAVLVARDDPLDTYLVHHPEAVFGTPVEATVLDPANPYVLGPQLACAAAEAPLTPADLDLFGDGAKEAVEALVEAGALRQRPTGWYWRHRERPAVDLRGEGGAPVCVVEAATGRLLGTVDGGSSHFLLHTGAVYLHQGVSYVVDALDLDDGCALVRPEEPDWSTHARDVTALSVVSVRSYVDAGPVGLFLGEVDVTSQVVSYQRRRIATGEVIDTRPLDLPARELRTAAVWFTLSPSHSPPPGWTRPTCPGRCTRPNTPRSGCCPWWPPATGGTSAGSPRRCTRTPRPRPSSSTTAIRGCGLRGAGVRHGGVLATGHPRRHRGVRLRGRLPVLRPVTQVRQRQQPAVQAGRHPGARRGTRQFARVIGRV